MVKIKITRGGCGIDYTDDNGVKRHTVKTPEDKPFDCDEAQAERLVRLGVAEYVTAPQIGAKQDEHDDEEDPDDVLPDLDAADPE